MVYIFTTWLADKRRIGWRFLGAGFEVYWYGIFIVGGIAFGGVVVSLFSGGTGTAVFRQSVPVTVQNKPISALALPAEIEQHPH
ncbi:MAG: hypothetical protein M5U34_31045 [Chloroflexi bacterium]|nr:hypothetical protein [Chloroflexota bacterium]